MFRRARVESVPASLLVGSNWWSFRPSKGKHLKNPTEPEPDRAELTSPSPVHPWRVPSLELSSPSGAHQGGRETVMTAAPLVVLRGPRLTHKRSCW